MSITSLPTDLVNAYVLAFRALERRVAGAADGDQVADERRAVDEVLKQSNPGNSERSPKCPISLTLKSN